MHRNYRTLSREWNLKTANHDHPETSCSLSYLLHGPHLVETSSSSLNLPLQYAETSSKSHRAALFSNEYRSLTPLARPRYYHPRNLVKTPSYYPQSRAPILEDKRTYQRMEIDQLFFIFYYMTGTYEQYVELWDRVSDVVADRLSFSSSRAHLGLIQSSTTTIVACPHAPPSSSYSSFVGPDARLHSLFVALALALRARTRVDGSPHKNSNANPGAFTNNTSPGSNALTAHKPSLQTTNKGDTTILTGKIAGVRGKRVISDSRWVD